MGIINRLSDIRTSAPKFFESRDVVVLKGLHDLLALFEDGNSLSSLCDLFKQRLEVAITSKLQVLRGNEAPQVNTALSLIMSRTYVFTET